MFFEQVMEEPNQIKNSVESVECNKKNFYLFLGTGTYRYNFLHGSGSVFFGFWSVFFGSRPCFFGSVYPNFVQIRIRTEWKTPIQIRRKGPGSEILAIVSFSPIIFTYFWILMDWFPFLSSCSWYEYLFLQSIVWRCGRSVWSGYSCCCWSRELRECRDQAEETRQDICNILYLANYRVVIESCCL